MRTFILAFACLFLGLALAVESSQTLSVLVWPIDSPNPQQLAQITYGYPSLNYSVKSYTSPSIPDSSDIVRVGFFRSGKEDAWSGVATSAANFAPGRQPKLRLQLDARGQVYHVGFSASPLIGKTSGTSHPAELKVELVEQQAGPLPHLNKPIVVDAEGKVDDGKEPEKSFLQK